MGPRSGSTIGVGPVLQKARVIRGLTLEEAARGTKLPIEQIRALENEDFDALQGDVYVRGSLRSYSVFLGVDPDEVVGVYAHHAEEPSPPPPPPKMDRIERAIAATRLRDNPRVVLAGAALVVAALIAFGVLSRDNGVPLPAPIPTHVRKPASASALGAIQVALDAKREAQVQITVDGLTQAFSMKVGETRSFVANDRLIIGLGSGSTVHIVINGKDLGVPGKAGVPWSRSWSAASMSASPPPAG
jgi:Helix-turn-helix domain